MNELLPFGEYVPPEQMTAPHLLMGLDAYELDRLLARLALHNAGGGRRGRAQRQAARAAARRDISRGSSDAVVSSAALDTASAASSAAREDAGASSPTNVPHSTGNEAGAVPVSPAATTWPSSWPPSAHPGRSFEVGCAVLAGRYQSFCSNASHRPLQVPLVVHKSGCFDKATQDKARCSVCPHGRLKAQCRPLYEARLALTSDRDGNGLRRRFQRNQRSVVTPERAHQGYHLLASGYCNASLPPAYTAVGVHCLQTSLSVSTKLTFLSQEFKTALWGRPAGSSSTTSSGSAAAPTEHHTRILG